MPLPLGLAAGELNHSEAVADTYRGFGKRVRFHRELSKMTQEDLGRRVGLTRVSITNIERGAQKVLLHTMLDLARALGVHPQALLPVTLGPAGGTSNLTHGYSPSEQEWIEKVVTHL